jgi:hypothetical protein
VLTRPLWWLQGSEMMVSKVVRKLRVCAKFG